MDIEQLQEYIELVTFANLDELTNIDPLFVKLFRLSQFTIEYLLHSQDYLKLLISKETEKIAKRDKKIKNSDSELAKLRNEIIQLKKENKKRRRIVEEQQRMMEVGANSFYKCPICPSKTFINATYLQAGFSFGLLEFPWNFRALALKKLLFCVGGSVDAYEISAW